MLAIWHKSTKADKFTVKILDTVLSSKHSQTLYKNHILLLIVDWNSVIIQAKLFQFDKYLKLKSGPIIQVSTNFSSFSH